MPGKPTRYAQLVLDLAVGKSCVLNGRVDGYLRTAKRHHPDRRYSTERVDARTIVKRTA